MSVVKNIVAAIQGRNPEDKPTWVKIGVYIETNEGKQRIKIDALPRDPSWDGWCSVFDDQDRQQSQPRSSGGRQYPSAPPPRQPQPQGGELDDEIPFARVPSFPF